MAKKKTHLTQASRNRQLSTAIGERDSKLPEWVITAAFYEALHHIEAAFACDNNIVHTEVCQRSRENISYTRWRLIKRRFSKDVSSSYFILENASKSVRYLLSDYQQYYDKDVIRDFIDKDLHTIIDETKKVYDK